MKELQLFLTGKRERKTFDWDFVPKFCPPFVFIGIRFKASIQLTMRLLREKLAGMKC